MLRSPSHGTGWEETWHFSGRSERALRDCLAGLLDECRVEPPDVRWDRRKLRLVIEAEDRWEAAMLLRPDGFVDHQGAVPLPAESAWTAAGALRLAEILPGDLEDLRTAITTRFCGP